MIDDDLAPDLRALFDAEKRRDDGPPSGAKDRVSHALSISLGIGIGAAATAAGSASASIGGAAASKGALVAGAAANATSTVASTAAATTAVTTTAASVAAGTAATTAGVTATGGALAKGLAFALVTAMAGTTGTGIYLAARDEAPKALVVDVRPSSEVPSTFDPSMLAKKTTPPPAPIVEKPALAPIALAPLVPVVSAPVLEPVSKHETSTPEQKAERLRGERAVLDTARAAVSRGDGGAALIALEAHRDSYADGALVEEREALTVLALVKLGRDDDARAKAAAFQAKNPRSLFLGAIDGALR